MPRRGGPSPKPLPCREGSRYFSRHDGLVIEVDGGYHSEPQQQEDDTVREYNLQRMGYHVMRFSNEEVLFDIDNVIRKIKEYFEQ